MSMLSAVELYFFAMENKIKPIPNMISVMGQGSGRPRGFGLFKIINVESAIRRNPDIAKHIFDIFNIITSLLKFNKNFLFVGRSIETSVLCVKEILAVKSGGNTSKLTLESSL